MTALDRILDALREHDCGPRQSGSSWSARCPSHDDRNPSLSVRGIEGQALLHCHAGCTTPDVVDALGLTMRDLFDAPRRSGGFQVTAEYPYVDESGALLFVQERRFPKDFRPKRPNGSGWTYGLNGTRRVLYRLPSVVAAVNDGRTVYLVEGEKDCHAVESLGAVATTAPQGAAGFAKVDTAPLHGAEVVAVVDRDDNGTGDKWAVAVRTALQGRARTLRFVQAKIGKDTSDHIVAGHGLDEFTELPGPEDSEEPVRRLVLTAASAIRPERQRWLWADRIPLDALCLLAGREGLGKSTIATDLAAQVTRGDVDGELHGQPRDVLIVATEDNRATTIVPRLIAAQADLARVHFVTAEVDGFTGQPVLPADTALLSDAIGQTRAALVILDAATSVLDGRLDGDRDRQMRQALEPLGRIAGEHRCSVLGIVHFGKRADADTGKLILGSIAWSQVARAVLAVARDEDSGDLLVQPTKHNLAPGDTTAVAARLVPAVVDTEDGPTSVGRVEWLGETDTRAVDLLGRRADDPDDAQDRDDAAEWLAGYLRARPDRQASAKDVLKAGQADGHPAHVLKRAKRRAGVESHRISTDDTGAGHWVWTLTDPQGSAREPREQAHVHALPCDSCAPLGQTNPEPEQPHARHMDAMDASARAPGEQGEHVASMGNGTLDCEDPPTATTTTTGETRTDIAIECRSCPDCTVNDHGGIAIRTMCPAHKARFALAPWPEPHNPAHDGDDRQPRPGATPPTPPAESDPLSATQTAERDDPGVNGPPAPGGSCRDLQVVPEGDPGSGAERFYRMFDKADPADGGRCPVCGTERWPGGLCVGCAATEGGNDAA